MPIFSKRNRTQNWKGVWRWYDESMLECCKPLQSFQDDGMSFEDYGDLARCLCLSRWVLLPLARQFVKYCFICGRCNGCDTQQWRADESNIEHFRSIVRQVTQTSNFRPQPHHQEIRRNTSNFQFRSPKKTAAVVRTKRKNF